ncbi:FAD-binding protein [Streptomyces sp. IBSBF 2953]|uniref:FAD-binding oxidoreductase n=1 Tax=Streptomyces TaxID=1883 RepID=UPI002119BD6C|nr:FAD-binding protein [Streptomyces scabiei]MCQ9177708.1 FAD-binding protein [Streptomyces hayashii]MDX3115705.1 FAD-binding protein [Streptomyces scabiei]
MESATEFDARGGPAPIGRDDSRYTDLTRGCNQRFTSEPDAVYLVTGTAETVSAVQAGVAAGARIAVRSGGHCQERLVDAPEVGVLIDMSMMRAIEFDAGLRAFMVEPGVQLGELYRTLFRRWGVTVPGGSCPSVGVGGHVVGGAYGPLSRRLGYLVDYLYAVEVVVVDGDGTARAVVATRAADDPNHDLWWAHTGGGGGNFGVVTRYWLRSPDGAGDDPGDLLPRPPHSVHLRYVAWPWASLHEEDFLRLVKNHVRWYERNSHPGSPGLGLYSGLLLPHKSAGGVVLNVQMDATVPEAEKVLAEYLDALDEGMGSPGITLQKHHLPWHRASLWNVMYTSSGLETQRSKIKAADMRTCYSDEQLSTIHRWLTTDDYDNPASSLMFIGCGGQVNTVAPDATAIPQRSSVLKLVYSTNWTDPAEDDKHLTWIREWYHEVHKATGGVPVSDEVTDGTYINNPDTDLLDPRWNSSGVPWHALYYQDNYPRLRRIKARWDPLGVFSHALSVEPAVV